MPLKFYMNHATAKWIYIYYIYIYIYIYIERERERDWVNGGRSGNKIQCYFLIKLFLKENMSIYFCHNVYFSNTAYIQTHTHTHTHTHIYIYIYIYAHKVCSKGFEPHPEHFFCGQTQMLYICYDFLWLNFWADEAHIKRTNI